METMDEAKRTGTHRQPRELLLAAVKSGEEYNSTPVELFGVISGNEGRGPVLTRSVAEKFSTLVQNLRTDNDEVISARRRAITRRINLDFRSIDSETQYSRYVGSYGRGTAINGFSDVDLLVILPAEVYYRYNDYAFNGQSRPHNGCFAS